MASLRTEAMKQRYKEHQKVHPLSTSCALCEKEALKTFTHWKIMQNDFPYDMIASEHHMLVPVRHVTENELNAAETKELSVIKDTFINPTYDFIIEATPKNKSIPAHFHLHLVISK